jgi:peptidoglycan/xylan/chitin deacetylase (PgdA/CDA1 family)
MHNRDVLRFRSTLFAVAVGVAAILLATTPVLAAGSAKMVRYVDTNKKIIALTFDDGYSPMRAEKIVNILDQYGATATFFPYANAADDAPSVWRQIARRFPIGNHTTTHPHLTQLSAAQIFWEIDNARKVIEGITGRPMVPIFRPPYMLYNATVQEQAYRAGFDTMALWTVDTDDALGADAQTIYSRAIKGQPGQIILMHAGPAATVQALPRIMQFYSSRGYTFVNLPEMFGIPWSPDATAGSGGTGGGTGTGNVCDTRCPIEEYLHYATVPCYVRASPQFRAAID